MTAKLSLNFEFLVCYFGITTAHVTQCLALLQGRLQVSARCLPPFAVVGCCSVQESSKAGLEKAAEGRALRVLRVRGAEPQRSLTPPGAPGAGLRSVEILQHHRVNFWGCFGLRAKN